MWHRYQEDPEEMEQEKHRERKKVDNYDRSALVEYSGINQASISANANCQTDFCQGQDRQMGG